MGRTIYLATLSYAYIYHMGGVPKSAIYGMFTYIWLIFMVFM